MPKGKPKGKLIYEVSEYYEAIMVGTRDLKWREKCVLWYLFNSDYDKDGITYRKVSTIAKAFDVSDSAIKRSLCVLRRKGYLVDQNTMEKGVRYDPLENWIGSHLHPQEVTSDTPSRSHVTPQEVTSEPHISPSYIPSSITHNNNPLPHVSPDADDYERMYRQMEESWKNQPKQKRFDTKNVSK
jgi:hypothetical protein